MRQQRRTRLERFFPKFAMEINCKSPPFLGKNDFSNNGEMFTESAQRTPII